MKKTLLALITSTCCVAPAFAADPLGDWLVKDRTAVIRVEACGTGAFCGMIVWSKEPGVDEHNPDPALRSRPILGLPILIDMKPSGEDKWSGSVYNAENGKTYTSHITLKSAGVLRIDGCVLGGLICGGEEWTRTTCDEAKLPNGKAAPKGAPKKFPVSCRVAGP